ncbi:pilus assembly PilX family protein [Congregibacter litoralis]|uniref:Tfp pilus assembly protein PilX n=1 Tax=Congregibacter litoralis KT71 TaxID=314285 RepID=A4ADT8_9GAMM|nr:PilX N-terminal domain-containing pilus assembly protein [Congregibacter litoralis]EAQ95820.2 Tfp pilus assembly protein PilX [Congregibacter litoralis KT71]
MTGHRCIQSRRASTQCLRRQRGIVLPVVIILMVVMSILAISGMDDTAMQERMAGNLRDRDIAFQGAESALREGEAWLQANAAAAAVNANISGVQAADWNGVAPAPTNTLSGLYASGSIVSLAADPAFYVGPPELLRVNPGETPPEFREVFPVISRSLGATNATVVILRSTFEPL